MCDREFELGQLAISIGNGHFRIDGRLFSHWSRETLEKVVTMIREPDPRQDLRNLLDGNLRRIYKAA